MYTHKINTTAKSTANGNIVVVASAFIREVQIILPLFNDHPAVKNYVWERINTWEQIKYELIKNFGVGQSYLQLYHQAISSKLKSLI